MLLYCLEIAALLQISTKELNKAELLSKILCADAGFVDTQEHTKADTRHWELVSWLLACHLHESVEKMLWQIHPLPFCMA